MFQMMSSTSVFFEGWLSGAIAGGLLGTILTSLYNQRSEKFENSVSKQLKRVSRSINNLRRNVASFSKSDEPDESLMSSLASMLGKLNDVQEEKQCECPSSPAEDDSSQVSKNDSMLESTILPSSSSDELNSMMESMEDELEKKQRSVLDRKDEILAVGRKIGAEPVLYPSKRGGYATQSDLDISNKQFKNFVPLTKEEEEDIMEVFRTIPLEKGGIVRNGIVGIPLKDAKRIVEDNGYKLRILTKMTRSDGTTYYEGVAPLYDATVLGIDVDQDDTVTNIYCVGGGCLPHNQRQ